MTVAAAIGRARKVDVQMTNFHDLLYPATVRAHVDVESKKTLFPLIGELAAQSLGLDASEVADGLVERERLGSTGFGKGVALPHAKLQGLSGVRGLFLQLAKPIEFDSVDALPVDLIFVLLSPVDSGAEHLKALARASRFLRDERAVEKLRGVKSTEALYALLATDPERDAA